MIIAGNKSDQFEFEEVNENYVRAFAKEYGIAFKLVSAKSANGIDVRLCSLSQDLFEMAGKMLLDPSFKDASLLDLTQYNSPSKIRNPIKISRISQKRTSLEKEQKKGCC